MELWQFRLYTTLRIKENIASVHMVCHLNTPGKTLVDVKIWEYVSEMCMFTVKPARSFVCVSPLTVLQATLVIRTSSNSFLILSSCFPVTLLTLELGSVLLPCSESKHGGADFSTIPWMSQHGCTHWQRPVFLRLPKRNMKRRHMYKHNGEIRNEEQPQHAK